MAFDGIITKLVVNELNTNIINSRVEKIYMPNKNEVLFNLHINRSNLKLLISIEPTNCRMHLTTAQTDNPAKATQFCMVLRKYLQGAKLISINQYNLDRIIEITFENINELGDLTKNKLVVELMGKHSNIILLNNANKIIDSLKYVDSSVSSLREVLPAREYSYPENQTRANFLGMSFEEFSDTVKDALMTPTSKDTPFSTRLANEFTGFSRTFTNDLCSYLNIDSEFYFKKMNELYSTLILIFHNISENNIELMNIDNDYHINLNLFSQSDNKLAISNFLDNYYQNKENAERLKNIKYELQKNVISQIYKLEKKLDIALEILSSSADAETYKQYGELISSNIYKMKIGMKEIQLENFYNDNKEIVIKLKENLSPAQNAQSYFKKYSKLKSSILHATAQKEEYETNINYLETIIYEIDEVTTIDELNEIKEELIAESLLKNTVTNKKKQVSTSEPLKYEFKGITILVGKNNIQNDKLTFKIAHKKYTWLHTKSIHGSHVIIESEDVPDDVIQYAANLAAIHSKAKGEKKTPIDYTLVKNVHKPAGAKPGMVTYTDYKTILST